MVNRTTAICISTPEHIRIARELFGRTFCVGSRNDYPPVHNPPHKLLSGNVVNLVRVDGNAPTVTHTFEYNVLEHGADLIFDINTQRLCLHVRYDYVSAGDEYLTNLLHMAPRHMDVEELNNLPEINLNTRFIVQGILVKVINVIDKSHVVVELTRGDPVQMILEYNEAVQLIIDCNK